jgi:glycosyltransferase involved in cell wall biosynthesis
MKKILMIAFHFPPYRGGSGVHRTLSFARHLPDYGWQPIVLTANPRAYPKISGGDRETRIHEPYVAKAFSLDASKHLSFRGLYFQFMGLPDRWVTWWFGAVPAGMRLIRAHRPAIIWSTYPIATAQLIGLTLHRLTGIPWVADFRDPMTEKDPISGEEFPPDPLARRFYRWIERNVVKRCHKVIMTTPGTLRMYAERYPGIPESQWEMIANGYDEEDFSSLERSACIRKRNGNRLLLVHSGLLYPSERDPSAFFAALSDLRKSGKISSSDVRIILRGSGNEDSYRSQLLGLGLEEMISLEPLIPHQEALKEMLGADGLLVFQASNCNRQIPAKIYEYLHAGRPILGLTDPKGDTASLLNSLEIHSVVPLDSREKIAKGFLDFMQKVRDGTAPIPKNEEVLLHSRKYRAKELAKLLDTVNLEVKKMF